MPIKDATKKKEAQARADAKRAGERTRNWTCVVYPTEGNPPAPADWRDIIDQEHIEWIESPLHDKDTNADGTPKRAHKHVLLMFENVKTYEQVKELTDKLNAPIPQKCNGAKGLVRYMAHLDNPEKAQYCKAEIIGHGGADVAQFLTVGASERYEAVAQMMDFCEGNGITEMCDLLRYARREKRDEWFPLLCDNSAYIMDTFLRSLRHSGGRKAPAIPAPAPAIPAR